MDKELKAIIVDDDGSARNILKKFLELAQSVEVMDSVANAKDAMKALEEHKPHVIFLDINMPEESGLEFAGRIRDLDLDVKVIFTTAYAKYASEAFALKPLDYLVKPFGLDELFDVLTKVEKYFSAQEQQKKDAQVWGNLIPEKLKFKTSSGYSFLNPQDIFYIKVDSLKTEVCMVNGEKEAIVGNLKNIYEQIAHLKFFRINRSVIVNMTYIERLERKNRKCFLLHQKMEADFLVSKSSFKELENMKSIRIG